MLKSISELFIDGAERYSDKETQLFSDVLCTLIDRVSVDERVCLSQRIAPLAATPRAVVLRLAKDDVLAVSEAVLEHSPVLTDSDLHLIARSSGQEHLLAIAKRSNLSEAVTEVLVDRGDQLVLEGVSGNVTARFSDDGLRRLSSRAVEFPTVLKALSQRTDIPPDRMARVVISLDAGVRAKLETLVATSPDIAAALFTEADEDVCRRREDLKREVESLVKRIEEWQVSLDECIANFSDDSRMEAIAELLIRLSDLDDAHVHNALHHDNDFGISIICRSLNIGENAYRKLSRLRCAHLGLPACEIETMANNYAQIDQASSGRALRFHRVRAAIIKNQSQKTHEASVSTDYLFH